MNVLITSAGRRNYLVEYFREAFHGSGFVAAADVSAYAPALYAADRSFLVPPLDDSTYIDTVIELCVRHEINLLVSVNDLELPTLALSKGRFAAVGTTVLVSDPDVIATCYDKLLAASFMQGQHIDCPRTAQSGAEAIELLGSGELSLPLIVKPRLGSASLAVEIVHDVAQMNAAILLAESRIATAPHFVSVLHDAAYGVIVQEFIQGQEYGLDIMNDLDGNYIATSVKKKLTMRAGETDKAITVRDERIEDIGRRISQAMRHVGVIDCDLIVSDGRAVVLDLNPRFGGGYPFSHRAGVNMPAAIHAWLTGRDPDPAWFRARPDVASAKYDVLATVGDATGGDHLLGRMARS